eukprot:PhM_4_TR9183/c1_g2_i5/m.67747
MSTSTEHYRKLYTFGFHPTVTRAVMLLRISKYLTSRLFQSPSNDYELWPFTTETVLSFSIDTTQVLVVDVSTPWQNPWRCDACPTTCLVFDDTPDSERVVRATYWFSTPPEHFIFAPMRFRRALHWVKQSNCEDGDKFNSFSLDMHRIDSMDNSDIDELQRHFAENWTHRW